MGFSGGRRPKAPVPAFRLRGSSDVLTSPASQIHRQFPVAPRQRIVRAGPFRAPMIPSELDDAARCPSRHARAVTRKRPVVRECTMMRVAAKRSWRKWASWWIWWTIDHQIHHEARILHAKVKTTRTSDLILGRTGLLGPGSWPVGERSRKPSRSRDAERPGHRPE